MTLGLAALCNSWVTRPSWRGPECHVSMPTESLPPLHWDSPHTQLSLLLPLLSCSAHVAGSLQIDQMFAAFPPDVTGNLDYKNLVHIITHGEEKD